MKATVRIQVTLEVAIAETWSRDDVQLGQVKQEAIAVGLKKLHQVLGGGDYQTGVKVIGEPRVMIVLVED